MFHEMLHYEENNSEESKNLGKNWGIDGKIEFHEDFRTQFSNSWLEMNDKNLNASLPEFKIRKVSKKSADWNLEFFQRGFYFIIFFQFSWPFSTVTPGKDRRALSANCSRH